LISLTTVLAQDGQKLDLPLLESLFKSSIIMLDLMMRAKIQTFPCNFRAQTKKEKLKVKRDSS
jgi:hypothetical protein